MIMDRPNRGDFLRVRLESTGDNRLIETYMHRNMTIDDAIEETLLQDAEVKVIAFSDSAFIATDRVYDAVDIAQSIWTRLMRERIQVRFGARSPRVVRAAIYEHPTGRVARGLRDERRSHLAHAGRRFASTRSEGAATS